MGFEPARDAWDAQVARDARDARDVRGATVRFEAEVPPLIVWEGGSGDGGAHSLDASRVSRSAGDVGVLSIALDAPALPWTEASEGPGRDADARGNDGLEPVSKAQRVRSGWKATIVAGILCVAATLLAIALRGAFLDTAYGSLQWEEHRVVPGETIASIISARDLPDVGLGRLVEWVEDANGLESADIRPGMVLSMPR